MESELLYYKGLVGGFKKVYSVIESSEFVAYKGKRNTNDFKEILRIQLDADKLKVEGNGPTEVFPYGKENIQFMMIQQTQKKKKMEKSKHFFKCSSTQENQLWIQCINKFTLNIKDD